MIVDLPTARVFRASYYRRGGRLVAIGELRWVVECELCQYAYPFRTREAAETQRITHLRSAHSDAVIAGVATVHLAS